MARDLEGIVLNLNLKVVATNNGKRLHPNWIAYRIQEMFEEMNRPHFKKLYRAINCIFANAIICYLSNEPIKAGRGTKFYGKKTNNTDASRDSFNQTFDWLVKIGLLTKKNGFWDKEKGKGEYTAYFLTQKFITSISEAVGISGYKVLGRKPGKKMTIVEAAKAGLYELEFNTVKIMNIKGVPGSRNKVRLKTRGENSRDVKIDPENALAKESSELIIGYDKTMKKHEIRVKWLLFQPKLQRIFTTDTEHHGRFYSRPYMDSYQKFGKDIRKGLTIDGEEVCEYDYSGTHLRLAYHLEGINFQGDLYDLSSKLPKRLNNRSVLKKLINTALNAKNPSEAVQATFYWLHRNIDSGESLPSLNVSELNMMLEAAQAFHAPVASYFGADAGMRLMFYDSEICRGILSDFVSQSKPVLPIHDSFICRASDIDFLKQSMVSNWRRITREYGKSKMGYLPVITDSFK